MIDLGSVHPVDAGFDVRTLETPVRLEMQPGEQYRVKFADGTVEGDAEAVCRVLSSFGYRVTPATTPNGREVRYRNGSFEVQPHDDNYWIGGLATLGQAFEAYHDPARFRS